MDFIKDFFEDFDEFKKQQEIDGDDGSMQVAICAEKKNCAQDERYKDACNHGKFLRMMLGFASGEGRKKAEARLDVADSIRDIAYEAEVLARIGEDKTELTDEEFEKLCSVRDYLQMVLVGIRQFKEQFTASLEGGTDGK